MVAMKEDKVLGLGSFRITCRKCDCVCEFHETYWTCPKCSSKITMERVMNAIDNEAHGTE